MSRPITAYIHRRALQANLARARDMAPGARIWAVLKADGYGHGLLRVARALESADGFALVEFDRALNLRAADPERPILMLEGPFDASDVDLARAAGLELVIHHLDQLAWVLDAATAQSARALGLWLKFDSGMRRLGFDAPGLRRAAAMLAERPGVAVVGLMTHFANADRAGGVESPMARFHAASAGLGGPRSMANSAALLATPATHGDWVRPGIMLYGGSPFDDRSAAALGLSAAMSLRSRLIAIQHLAPGDELGYGGAFRASAPMRVGVVACGYADGYPRHAPAGTPVRVGGVRTRLIGRVSMDMLTVDLGPVAHAQLGTEVELWGAELPIDEVAAAAGTIGYELMCALAPRVAVQETD